MWGFVAILPRFLLRICTVLVAQTTRFLLVSSFLLSLAYHFGWIHRLMWFSAERELSKLLNGTPVTIGSMKVDLLRGKAWISNLVLHSPQRRKWKWQSPVLARVGQVYCEVNLVHCIFFEWIFREIKPLEIYTLEVSDIQAFVERKQHVFNFYLMDKNAEIPDPIDYHQDDSPKSTNKDDVPINTTLTEDPTAVWHTNNNRGAADTLDKAPSEQEKAQRLVDDMVRALGRATQQGSLHGALLESREHLKSQLKALQTTKKKSEAMQVGVKLVQQVSKSLVEKSQNVPQIVLPARKKTPSMDRIVYGRIGRVVIKDSRIFTRDHQFETADTNNKKSEEAMTSVEDEFDEDDNREESSASDGSDGGSWNKPIWVEQVVVRAAELCPPLSAKDTDDSTLPAVYQPLDKCLEGIRTRVLTEVAKSNTGRLFQTAMGEVLDYWMEKKVVSGSGTAELPTTTATNI